MVLAWLLKILEYLLATYSSLWRLLKMLGVISGTGKAAPARPFRFLDLPAEIRNMIYDYVLQEKDFLTVRNNPRFRKASIKSVVITDDNPTRAEPFVFNQLQFVNWQFYHETKGLELKNTTFFFESGSGRFQDIKGVYRYKNFCNILNLHCLSHVILSPIRSGSSVFRASEAVDNLNKDMVRAAKFSAKNQHIHVDFHFEQWDPMRERARGYYRPHWFVLRGVVLSSVIRGVDISGLFHNRLLFSLWQLPTSIIMGVHCAQRIEELRPRLQNLRFWPTRHPVAPFDRQVFRKGIQNGLDQLRPVNGDAEVWIQAAELWTREGI